MSTLWKVIWREWKRIASLPAHYMVLLVLPPFVFFFFALIYENQHAKDLPVAVWDQDHSALSRKLTYMLEETPSIHISKQVHSSRDLEQVIQDGSVWGGIHFPKNLEQKIKSSHPVNVTLFTNSAAIVPAKLVYKDAAKVIIMGGSGVILQKLTKKGMEEDKARALVQPIKLTSYPLYNPTYNYQKYLAPGLITVILQMMIIMVSVLLINYEYKTGSFENLIKTGGYSATKIILGKTIAHLFIAWVNFILIVGIIFPYFGLSQWRTNGNFFVLFTFLALACIGLGMLVSVLFKDVMFATDVALFYTSPAFVFSGYTFPRWAMPWYDQIYAHLLPYTPFLQGFLKVYYMSLPLSYIYKELGVLLIFITITFPSAIIVFDQKLKKKRRLDAVVS